MALSRRLLGKVITIDGATGEVVEGELPTRQPELADHPQLAQLAAWAEELCAEIPDTRCSSSPRSGEGAR